METKKKSKFCEDCGLPIAHHIQTWADSIIESTLPNFLPKRFERLAGNTVESILTLLKITRYEKNFDIEELPLKSYVFIQEAIKEGLKIEAQKGPYGYTGKLKIKNEGKPFLFRWLPLTDT